MNVNPKSGQLRKLMFSRGTYKLGSLRFMSGGFLQPIRFPEECVLGSFRGRGWSAGSRERLKTINDSKEHGAPEGCV